MKLFLPNGFVLDEFSPDYCDPVQRVGLEAEEGFYNSFEESGTKQNNGLSVLKQLSKFYREGAVRAFIKRHYPRVKFSDKAIRLLRLKLPQAESNSSELASLLSEAFTALLQGGRRRIEGSHVRAWPGLPRESSDAAEQKEPTFSNNDTADSDHSNSDVIWIPPPRVAEVKLTPRQALGDGDSSSSDEKTEPTEALAAGNYYARSISNSYIRDGRRVYVADWEATEEPAANLPPRMVAAFNRRRRDQVRRASIEDEAGHTRERRRSSAEAPSSRRRPLRRLRRSAYSSAIGWWFVWR
ncbi:uncharacterized protein PITG_17268 [Phytophthora infestans T30-4]|uniref:Uncharacterized protein n=1 Tax=Phytophthora infestans (strain T30-4) TaxID=403677 RepID=D0NVN5_PHYIT|nr:uncharacterized protein PITG_17268 [Phytophthora infestans T30-4]EEY66716.1 conserved hypothetical protein [Phytophthora infestans T30-4]|eukprot:XP_002896781.1 conserved hypothetical protein [Phytophthora infestans T30-4]